MNLLPHDGEVIYFGKIFSQEESTDFFNKLMEDIPWENDQVKIFGKEFITKRKVAWFGDDTYEYTYSGKKKTANRWTNTIFDLKTVAEKITLQQYNSCLLNLYHSGEESMGFHSDNEKELVEQAAIAVISFGAERKFVFKHKITKEKVEIILENGSLLVMKGSVQEFWQHSIPKSLKIKTPRISLTFRKMKKNPRNSGIE